MGNEDKSRGVCDNGNTSVFLVGFSNLIMGGRLVVKSAHGGGERAADRRGSGSGPGVAK